MSVQFDTRQFGINCELRAISSGALFLPNAAMLIMHATEHNQGYERKTFYSI